MTGALIAMAIGVLASSVIHLSQGMMKLGIQRLRSPAPAARARTIYTAGLALNFTAPLWVMLANPFAPTVYFTSMYATGLIVLLIFSCAKLGECLERRQVIGVAIIIVGTLVIAGGELAAGATPMQDIEVGTFMRFAAVWVVAVPLIAVFVQGSRRMLRETFFGLAAGGFLALDALVKGLAQAGDVGSTLLPQHGLGWLLLAVSFLGAAGAFGMMQWAYIRSCRAPMVASTYNVGYVTLPLILIPAATEGGVIGWWCVIGVAMLATGVVLLQGRKSPAIS